MFSSNDGEVLRDWALAGMGIIERSEWSVAANLKVGRLQQVLPGQTLPDADVVALLNPAFAAGGAGRSDGLMSGRDAFAEVITGPGPAGVRKYVIDSGISPESCLFLCF